MKLVIRNLSKTYPNGVRALDQVDLTISQGMFGLLGPNGAGKSSLMRTIATLQSPDEGSVDFDGIDVLRQPEQIRQILGYLPQEFGVYPKVNALTLLDHLAVLKGIGNATQRREVVEALLHRTNLWEARKKNLGGFSGGMKQRFGIAQALLANPKLIIVDEPTAGLDPEERNRFYNLLSELGQEAIVILSTHIVEDVKELCTSMAIINKGQILKTANPLEAIEELNGQVWEKRIAKEELKSYQDNFQVISNKLIAGQPQIHVLADTQPEEGFELVKADLEDVYFSTIKRHTSVMASVSTPENA
ncbi:ABC transporter ATP-binding protein [Pontibacter sp. G13]|uniref:ABC transporter ATP-binding protein n=1 Tax=Pontibacter sp. G13 TaxID=3074898 RepID=UPI00288A6BCF|nr:ABC transporter ATP-binding protein [Pontibacter sp. G13]WNJ16823.1 ABC transporter ATP-binding protein [Pontibacter sp. G13]